MEKKNTMLLTVIAVATLLVAVVGATFAYFSLTVSGEATNTTAKVGTSNLGMVTLTDKNIQFELSVTAEDMAMPSGGKDEYYYAMKKGGDGVSSSQYGGKFLKQEGDSSAPSGATQQIAEFTVNGGEATDEYTCGYKVTVEAPSNMLDKLSNSDLNLTIEGAGLSSNGTDTSAGNVQTDLKDLEGSNGTKSKVYNGKFKLSGDEDNEAIQATLYLVNSNSRDQKDLAGLDLTVTIKVESDGQACTITKTE